MDPTKPISPLLFVQDKLFEWPVPESARRLLFLTCGIMKVGSGKALDKRQRGCWPWSPWSSAHFEVVPNARIVWSKSCES
jgi:hypothetical protein